MTTITGKIESAAGETLHAKIYFTSRSTPQFPPTIVQVNTVKRVLSDEGDGTFSVQLAAGNYAVLVRAKNLDTNFEIAVPEGDATISIEDLVTSSVAVLPGDAPYTVWNGQRAGHVTFLPIADPAAPVITEVDYPGSHINGSDEYVYAISHVTPEGETFLSAEVTVNASGDPDRANRVALAVNPERVTTKRIWRNRLSGAPGASALYLLAEVAPAVASYDDWESHTDFLARATYPPNPPTFNTTAGSINASARNPILYFSISGLRCLTAAQFDGLATFTTGLLIPTGAGAGLVLTSDADGLATWQTPSGGGGAAGAGSPEGVVTASPGQTYLNTTDESVWWKKTGTGNTGWIMKME